MRYLAAGAGAVYHDARSRLPADLCRRAYHRRRFFCVVLPVDIGNAFIERATAMGWHLRLRTDVAETELRPPHRVLLAFSPTAGECFCDRLAIRGPEQQYSEGFTALTGDFYLFM